jgi:predicted CoA-binding protein
MATKAAIDEFLGYKKLALMRLSKNTLVHGVLMDDELRPKGYEVTVVYLDDSTGGPKLSSVKDEVEGVIIAVPKDQAERAVREAIEAKVPRIWLQAGSETPEAIALCEQNRTGVVSGACVLMYAEPVSSFHAFHRWLWKTFGLLAK